MRSLLTTIKTLRLPPEVTLVITKDDDVFFKDLPGTLSLTCDIQHTIESAPGASLLDLPHQRMNLTMHIELNGRVDELSLKVK